jgi:hypothetical protein
MFRHVARWFARARAVQHALETLLPAPENTLLILPSTRTALALARRLCDFRMCGVTAGPITTQGFCRLARHVRSPQEIAIASADFVELQFIVISFPDQIVGNEVTFAPVPFLGSNHWFPTFEAALVVKHRPRVYALESDSLVQIRYDDVLHSLPDLMVRLLRPLELELMDPPSDWLAARCLTQKSESGVRSRMREDLKEIECLLRLHARSVGCDRLRTSTAIAAVVSRLKMLGAQ